MKKALRPFQQVGRDFLASRWHALLADEPGLGKTIQAIAAVEKLGLKSVLVVCPASVRLGWWQEIEECVGIAGSGPGWSVISYNEAASPRYKRDISRWDAIILDEAHFLKTPDSQRTRAIFRNENGLARFAHYKWALTGTPVLNRPRELYPILKCLASEKIKPYDNFAAYAYRYCGAFWDGIGVNTRGASRLDELAGRLDGFMLRRTKTEVLPELPRRIITRVPVSLADGDLSKIRGIEAEIANRESLLSLAQEGYAQLGDLATLLRVTGEAKVGVATRFVDDLAETTLPAGKVVVFARHREVIRRLAEGLSAAGRGVVVYIGGMSDEEKQRAVDAFVNDPTIHIFIGNIQAAGTGINGLQKVASDVVFAELSWVPGEIGQAIDRVHRMGGKGLPVNSYLLHAPGTLESAVLGVHDGKQSVIDRLLDEDPHYLPKYNTPNQDKETIGI